MDQLQGMIKKPIFLLILLGLVLVVYLQPNQSDDQLTLVSEKLAESSTEQNQTNSEKIETSNHSLIFVDLQGEVERPGVYQLELGSRMVDLLEKAGGLTQEAYDRNINRAMILEDQMSIYIENIHEINQQDAINIEAIVRPEDPDKKEDNSSALININLAEVEELQTLKGIGPAKAQAIVSFREENGAFESIESIKDVPGIGPKIFENIKAMIVVK
ncbi:helix-hairpin-helix domain-containing protein [Ignavigranum ruoffiae]|uniref:helix-hairpin-helix domain-containing protein n=1 Tax=Ignavigranum ruoffiae TaxID=89093 RepID=UPI0020512CBA|nr:helix-hairpin-helix domain-containing protein [Ignavigranum ruoffiae]UPQ85744.1 helix-hairpin-helix domain-containing protein [Ignavigranum ruoffiae]